MNTTIIEALFNNILVLLPLRIVHAYERGVKFRFGRDVAELAPGVHWFWPFFESVESVNIAPETRNLPTQSVVSKDGKAVSFSCNICYRIVDARRMYVSVQDFDHALEAYAMVHMAAGIGQRTIAAVKREREEIETELAESLTAKVSEWGAAIEWVGLTDLVEARAYRLFGDPPGL